MTSKAVECYKSSLKIKLSKNDMAEVMVSFNNLAVTYLKSEEYNKAIEYLERNLGIIQGQYDNILSANIAATFNNLGTAYLHLKKYKEAIDFYTRSLKIKLYIKHEDLSDKIAQCMAYIKLLKLITTQTPEKELLIIKYGIEGLVRMYEVLQNHADDDIQIAFANLNPALDNKLFKSGIEKLKSVIPKCIVELSALFFTDHYWQTDQPTTDHEKIKTQIYNGLRLINVNPNAFELSLVTSSDGSEEEEDRTLLIEAIITGNMLELLRLIELGEDINKPDNNQASPLYYSLGYVGQPINLEIVRLLLEFGANVNQPMDDGDTPIHMAYYRGNKEAIQLLLEYGANINAVNQKGKTPLHCLLAQENILAETKQEIIKAYVHQYALTVRDCNCKTVIDYLELYYPEGVALFCDSCNGTSLEINKLSDSDINGNNLPIVTKQANIGVRKDLQFCLDQCLSRGLVIIQDTSLFLRKSKDNKIQWYNVNIDNTPEENIILTQLATVAFDLGIELVEANLAGIADELPSGF
jgi:tetratricopeptide (TPR) repeat protein